MSKKIGFDLVPNNPNNELTVLIFDSIKMCSKVRAIPRDYIEKVVVTYHKFDEPIILKGHELIDDLITEENFYRNVRSFILNEVSSIKIFLDIETIGIYLDITTEHLLREIKDV